MRLLPRGHCQPPAGPGYALPQERGGEVPQKLAAKSGEACCEVCALVSGSYGVAGVVPADVLTADVLPAEVVPVEVGVGVGGALAGGLVACGVTVCRGVAVRWGVGVAAGVGELCGVRRGAGRFVCEGVGVAELDCVGAGEALAAGSGGLTHA